MTLKIGDYITFRAATRWSYKSVTCRVRGFQVFDATGPCMGLWSRDLAQAERWCTSLNTQYQLFRSATRQFVTEEVHHA